MGVKTADVVNAAVDLPGPETRRFGTLSALRTHCKNKRAMQTIDLL